MEIQFDLWKFLAGLGIFLFGMLFIEESIKKLVGRGLKRFLRHFTSTPLKGILAGVGITAILQSSSIVSLMVLAFAGAGIIKLKNAISIIFGTNLGTTFTGWLVVWLGFGVDIESFALPLIAVGALSLILFSNIEKVYETGRFLMGFGLLFLGLQFMKVSIGTLAETYDLSLFEGWSVFVFFPIGLFMTAIIQSSSGAMVITLSALGSGIISIEAAAVMVVGSDLGTTVTTIIGSIKGSPIKKRVALSHVLVNVITAVLALSLLYPLLYMIFDYWAIEDPLFGLVVFHSTFNLLGILIVLPFIKPFAKFLESRFKQEDASVALYLIKTSKHAPEASIVNLQKELQNLIESSFRLNLGALHLNAKSYAFEHSLKKIETGFLKGNDYRENYNIIKQLEGEMVEYYLSVYRENLEPEDAAQLNLCTQSIRNAMSAVKQIKDIEHNLRELDNSTNKGEREPFEKLKSEQESFYLKLFSVFQSKNNAAHFEQLVDLLQHNQRTYSQFLKSVYQQIDQDRLSDVEISTLLTINREIHNSNRAFILAVKDAILRKQEAENFNTIPELSSN
ncbi:MAG: hypothetical protein GQ574_15860 [Crocinitomix sp.]|nr:hypothetical protein [Crocinitomix sp.]